MVIETTEEKVRIRTNLKELEKEINEDFMALYDIPEIGKEPKEAREFIEKSFELAEKIVGLYESLVLIKALEKYTTQTKEDIVKGRLLGKFYEAFLHAVRRSILE